ncbi:aminotransferase class I/II-fold pyridoxal phosphate-dependent enzyme [Microbacterium sp. cx-55]|uniref:aminotransferase class I/II-fold pyridoxal phosphate-dependent enzyme n=1 Tax=unclassified Microbacterium TaxID=2609290 RepID=UPI001CBF8DAC|nr:MULTISPECIES: aminotransferase class I/II-fold pyridoxal phosphate-dependent enzyme [unclassified Microbacterium]MBZ4486747.1 aminotransferase class I/II-fold pyridoxal phosphate-dependent enzyme [Microbacterium sp. cx-55]MCC4907724.1 aminotransferase class I/II-fold pyridoxal phosphate-dependent enzyme [Microbacterium sp. cx-59]UGB36296.1 aminotransferase class I/II-fold pyridoxal phosphate-dependent enzyme [Microbacterium sp. cx-55]
MISTQFQPFQLEEWQSLYELDVDFNLADSGVQPVLLSEMLTDSEAIADFLNSDLHYPAVNGTTLLRTRIAALYGPEVTPDEVLVTVGAAEANGLAVTTLTRPGDHVVVLEPGYRQVAGLAANRGCEVEAFHLIEAEGWRPDLEELERIVRPDTKLIAVNNPNNPTGAVLTAAEMDAIIAIAARVGAWILADEVYHGSELDGVETPSFHGRYDRLVVTNSLSKAYGLSGVRLGWIVGDAATVQELWRRHEYATISTSKLSMKIGELAVEPIRREWLLARNRRFVREGFARLAAWAETTEGVVTVVEPKATALAFPRIGLPLTSLEVAHELRLDGVLVGVGSHFGVESHIRVTHALDGAYMDAGLARMGETIARLAR